MESEKNAWAVYVICERKGGTWQWITKYQGLYGP